MRGRANSPGPETTFPFQGFRNKYRFGYFLPELETAEGVPDVRTVLGKRPQEIPDALAKRGYYQAAPDQFLIHVAQVGHYYISNGKRIIVEPDHSAESGMIKLFFLGTAFGALLLQRRVLAIHGSTVVIRGQAIIITGFSGAGKSALLAAICELRAEDCPEPSMIRLAGPDKIAVLLSHTYRHSLLA